MLLAIWRPWRTTDWARWGVMAFSRARGGSDYLTVVAFGLILAVMNLTFYAALDRIPLGIAVTIEFIGPLSVAVIGSRRALDVLWVALAVGGILLLAPLGLLGAPRSTRWGCCWRSARARVGRSTFS